MKNIERQRSLDKKKWNESFKQKYDLSGYMPYCHYCEKQSPYGGVCRANQIQRESECLCARAYNRQVKANAKNGSSKK